MLCSDCKKQQRNTLVRLVGGSELIARPITMSSSTVYLKVWYGSGSLERMAQRTAGHCWALDLVHYQFLFRILVFCLYWPTR